MRQAKEDWTPCCEISTCWPRCEGRPAACHLSAAVLRACFRCREEEEEEEGDVRARWTCTWWSSSMEVTGSAWGYWAGNPRGPECICSLGWGTEDDAQSGAGRIEACVSAGRAGRGAGAPASPSPSCGRGTAGARRGALGRYRLPREWRGGRKRGRNAWNVIIVLALFGSGFPGQPVAVFLLSFSFFPWYKAGIICAPDDCFLYVYAQLCLIFFHKQMMLSELCHCIYKGTHRKVEANFFSF